MGQALTPSARSSAISSVASTDSSVAEARKEHVFTMATSASSGVSASPKPALRRSARMRSVSTSFLAHPSVTKKTDATLLSVVTRPP